MPTSVPTSTGHPAPTDPIRTIMIDAPATVGPEESLLSVAQELVAGEIGAVLVVAAGAPTGLVSERDIVTVAASGGDLAREQAGDVMTTDLVTAAPGDSIAEVAALMRDAGVRHVPVRAGETYVGMVSVRDVLEVLLAAAAA